MPAIPYDTSLEALLHPERRATILGPSPSPGTNALAIEAARLAYVRVEDDPHERIRLAQDLARAGFDPPTTFDHRETGSQGFATLRRTDGLALVAFRGTQSDRPKDVLTDLRAWLVPDAGWPGAVHEGFARAANALLPAVTAWLDAEGAQRTQLLLCGHSLGAAIATLVAERVARDRAAAGEASRVQLVTLGSPRVGNAEFVSAVAALGIRSTRIVNSLDVVTRLPPGLLGYRHLGRATFVDEHGEVVTTSSPEHEEQQADDDDDASDAHDQDAPRNGMLPRRLADHAPVNYLRAFWP